MVDPTDEREWQTAVDAANMWLTVDSAEQYGLVTGPTVNVERCEDILSRGAARGFTPRPADVVLGDMLAEVRA